MKTALQFCFWHSVLSLANLATFAAGFAACRAVYRALWIEGIL
jgi:hypothetical protein